MTGGAYPDKYSMPQVMLYLDSTFTFRFSQVLHLYLSISSDFNHQKKHCPEYPVKELEIGD